MKAGGALLQPPRMIEGAVAVRQLSSEVSVGMNGQQSSLSVDHL